MDQPAAKQKPFPCISPPVRGITDRIGWELDSTLQAPVFDDNQHHFLYNYRQLGPLLLINSCLTPLYPAHFDHNWEVLTTNHLLSQFTPEVMALADSFTYMGLYLETHFIIMFESVSLLSIFLPYPIIGGLCEGGTQPTGMYYLYSNHVFNLKHAAHTDLAID